MSQTDIFLFLEKNSDKWFTSDEICTYCGIRKDNGLKQIRRMREYEELQYKTISKSQRKGNSRYLYKYKEIEDIIDEVCE